MIHHFHRYTIDQWGDLITLGSVFVAFLVMTYYAQRRTEHWDRLGVALTAVTACIAALFGLGFYLSLFGGGVWLLHARWVIRGVLTVIAWYAIVMMAADKPPTGGISS